jgi:outer membrane protein insertion porin family
MRRMSPAILALLVATAHAAEDTSAEAAVVERVEVQQNQFLPADTLLFYVSTRAGERYDELRLRDDFRRLWNTGFLDDLRLDVRDGATGKIATFVVQERKRVQIVDYRGHQAVSTGAIEDRLKEKEAGLRLDGFYDPSRARRVEGEIRALLLEKGRPFATVRHDVKSLGAAAVQVSFTVDEGPRALVRSVEFTGNQAFSDRTLRRRMKRVKPRSFWNLGWLTGRNRYTEEKWAEDAESVREHYLDHGYVTATLGRPVVTYEDGRAGFLRRKPVKWARIQVPVSEGLPYRVGTLAFSGLTVFKEEEVRRLFKLEPGQLYSDKRLRKGYDKLRDAYGAQGYFQWTPLTRRVPDEARKTVDVTLSMEEDKRYYVGRIRFAGNHTTRDKVLRREVFLNEADVFNTEALKLSIRRINQLGYFKPIESAPQLSPSAQGDDRIDVTFKVEEQNRNQFTLGGGVSGLEGTFVNASFQTSNFLGLGETLTLAAQSGARSNNYQVAVTEPYLFDRPITAGLDLFSRKNDYLTDGNVLGYSQVRTGSSVTTGLPLRRFTRLFASYTYEVIDTAVRDDLATSTGAGGDGAPVFDPFADAGRSRQSRLAPSVVHNTVDNPYLPRSGQRLSASVQLAGGPLGGTVSYWKPTFEAVAYLPHTRRTALGLRAEAGYVRPFGETAALPYYERFFLGGETQIRGVNVRTVSPVDAQNRALGGNKYLLFNAEYYFDVGGPLRFLLFYDAGESYSEGQGFYWKTLRSSTGAELRFLMPVLNVPFRLIYAWNANRDFFQPRTTFKFAVGTTF